MQPSPTDPSLIMFCHEGSWESVNRIWTIKTDGSGLRLMHERTEKNEIAGHEFWSHDGQMIWYDLQTPKSENFWLAGVNVYTGEHVRYSLPRNQWSVHYNESPDERFFSGDGGGPNSVANQNPDGTTLKRNGNGQWLYLFTPKDSTTTEEINNEAVKIAAHSTKKLVDFTKNNYELEPNATFTPDGKWIVFRSDMYGTPQVYIVKVSK